MRIDNKYSIRKYNGNEANESFKVIANIHKKIIDTGFLSSFSDHILSELYRAIAKNKSASLIVCHDASDSIVGFIAISFSTKSFYKSFLLGRGLLLAPYLIGRIFSIKFLKKLFETLTYPLRKDKESKIEQDLDSEILNFCVVNQVQGKGVGSLLFFKAIKEFDDNLVSTIKIVTGSNQKSAHNFYEKHGAVLIASSEIHKDIESLIYNYEILNN